MNLKSSQLAFWTDQDPNLPLVFVKYCPFSLSSSALAAAAGHQICITFAAAMEQVERKDDEMGGELLCHLSQIIRPGEGIRQTYKVFCSTTNTRDNKWKFS